VTGRVDDLDAIVMRPSAHRPVTTQAEFGEAVEAALRDPVVQRLVEQEGFVPYRPMPPYADTQLPDGRWDRIVTVGLRSESADLAHRIIGVRVEDGSVIHELGGVPVPTRITANQLHVIRLAHLRLDETRFACAGCAARHALGLDRGATEGMSGTNGSGVELRHVDRLGKRVLNRAHVPILNVECGAEGVRTGCGPTYRLPTLPQMLEPSTAAGKDWQWRRRSGGLMAAVPAGLGKAKGYNWRFQGPYKNTGGVGWVFGRAKDGGKIERLFGIDFHANSAGPKLHFHAGSSNRLRDLHRPWEGGWKS
jgi:hypothetical protein